MTVFATSRCTCGASWSYSGPKGLAFAEWKARACPSCGTLPCLECRGVRHHDGIHRDPDTGEPR